MQKSTDSQCGYKAWYTVERSILNPTRCAVAVLVERGANRVALKSILDVDPVDSFDAEWKAARWALSKLNGKGVSITLFTRSGEVAFAVNALKNDELEREEDEVQEFLDLMKSDQYKMEWTVNHHEKYGHVDSLCHTTLSEANL